MAWQWSGTSAQQSVGDHVKTEASSRRSNQLQTEAAAAGTEDHEKPLERSFGMSKTIFFFCKLLQITTMSSYVSVARDCCSSRAASTKKPVESATLIFRTS